LTQTLIGCGSGEGNLGTYTTLQCLPGVLRRTENSTSDRPFSEALCVLGVASTAAKTGEAIESLPWKFDLPDLQRPFLESALATGADKRIGPCSAGTILTCNAVFILFVLCGHMEIRKKGRETEEANPENPIICPTSPNENPESNQTQGSNACRSE
jgi:hypothetical protein